MANISVTYTFSNSTTADATEVNQNFTDIIDGTSDGSKDFSINALTVAGAATLNGNVTIGNASSDDLTVTASLASSVPIKTTNSYDIGSTTNGLRYLYLSEAGGVDTVRIGAGNTSSGGDWNFTLPTGAGVKGQALYDTAGNGTLGWVPAQMDVLAIGTGDYTANVYTITDTDGYRTYEAATSTTNRTVTLPTVGDNTDRIITVKKSDSGSGTVTVDGENSETLDGDSSRVLAYQYDSITVQSNGTEWVVLDQYPLAQVTDLEDGRAAELGLKQYLDSNVSSGAVTLSTDAAATVTWYRGVFIPYKMQDGTWRLRFTIRFNHGSDAGFDVTISGVTFKNVSNFLQAVATADIDGRARANPNASTITVLYGTATTLTGLSGDVELESKPTWAD